MRRILTCIPFKEEVAERMRERVLPKVFMELGVILTNGTSYIFKQKDLGSIEDQLSVNVTLARRVARQVSEDFTHSDHQAICMEIKNESSSENRSCFPHRSSHIGMVWPG